ncbi:FG-GAP repeat domain-containing protein [Geochorda subterranea]|uniref:Copper amine oxidase-like N-terminal domain-containing protein n=1 Tax=Geochorda subterranea TaxID=3109564 RepID=A0ABZ1BL36_9FIRM|nr:hypothetical protein [Limnochorda sp. LNt]WRP13235.1 hypothetical protein VLY81_07150 [Limnochorda sp. LNt]
MAAAAVLASLAATGAEEPRGSVAQAAAPTAPVAYVREAAAVLTGVQVLAPLPGPAGADRLVIGFSDRLEIGQLGADGRWRAEFTLHMPSGITALAVADLDGAGEQEIIAGSGGAGSLVRIRAVATRPVPVPVSGFLFGAARQLVVAELDGRPPTEVLAVNANGELFVYSAAAGGGYRRIWRSPPGLRASPLAAADLDGDGLSEVVVAGLDGVVTVYRWRPDGLQALGNAYPWGNVRAMTVASRAGEPPLLVVITDRDLVYVYRWDGQHLTAASAAYDADLRLRLDMEWAVAQVLETTRGAGSGTPPLVVEGAGPGGITILRVQADRVQLLGQTVWPGASPGYHRLADGRLLVIRPDQALDILRPVPADYLALVVDGRPWSLPPGTRMLWEGDRPLVDVEQLGRFAPVLVAHDRLSHQAWIVSSNDRVRVEADVPRADSQRASAPLPVAPRRDGSTGRLYVPLEVLEPLGWQVRYDPTVRQLTLRSPWPGGSS